MLVTLEPRKNRENFEQSPTHHEVTDPRPQGNNRSRDPFGEESTAKKNGGEWKKLPLVGCPQRRRRRPAGLIIN